MFEETVAGELKTLTLCGTSANVERDAPVGRWRRVTCAACLKRLRCKPQLRAWNREHERQLDSEERS